MAAQAGVWWRISWVGRGCAPACQDQAWCGGCSYGALLLFQNANPTLAFWCYALALFSPSLTLAALMRTPAAVVLCLTAATRPIMRPAASRSAPSQLILGRPPAASRSAPSQMIFGRPPPAPPAPPAPPPTTPATEIIQRDLAGYASLLALGVVPAVDWVTLIGPDAVNPARLACD